ncbi:MAG TPA: ABC transporter permease [Conexibacter sp.]|nr:ABC transporter permease [Conexibacter sp.]
MQQIAEQVAADGTPDPEPARRPAAEQSATGAGERLRRTLAAAGAPIVLIALIVVFSLLRPETFPTTANLTTILSTQSILVILALGTLVPLIAGDFDLSIGFVMGFAAMESALLTVHGMAIPLAIAITLATGVAIGLFNGLVVEKVGVSAFIATLAVGSILAGFTTWISGGTVVNGVPAGMIDLGRTEVIGLQLPILYMALLVGVFYYALGHTPVGRYLYAVGGGRAAARLAGINTGRLRILAFVVSATTAALAGVVNTTVVGSASADFGSSYLLPAFAGAFLGATTIQPGRFNVLGTVVAIFLLAVGIAGLQQLSAPFWIPPVFNGGALLIAVGLAVWRQPRDA